MAKRKKTAKLFHGTWRIEEMEQWDRGCLDDLGPAQITINDRDMGNFRFCVVQGLMDCHYAERDGKPAVEFSWEGNDDEDAVFGRGWAVLENEDVLSGHIFFHEGDDSGFRAVRSTQAGRSVEKRSRGGGR